MRRRLADFLPFLVIWLPLLISVAHVVGFTAWTTWLSFTPSDLLPEYDWAGLRSYRSVLRTENTAIAYANLLVYGVGYVGLTMLIGFVLAVLIDQRIRAENLLRTIYLYPLAVSFVVTGTVWSWLFNPGQGIQKFVNGLGWTSFRFDWIIDRDFALYTIIIAAVWHGVGFAMALFLAGLRSIDPDLHKAAQIDGAGPFRFYLRIAAPGVAPIAISVLVILLQYAIKTFDLVRLDRRRAGHLDHPARAGGLRLHVPARPARARLGRRRSAAFVADRGAAALLPLHALAGPAGAHQWIRRCAPAAG